jgi:hypothetical protein
MPGLCQATAKSAKIHKRQIPQFEETKDFAFASEIPRYLSKAFIIFIFRCLLPNRAATTTTTTTEKYVCRFASETSPKSYGKLIFKIFRKQWEHKYKERLLNVSRFIYARKCHR